MSASNSTLLRRCTEFNNAFRLCAASDGADRLCCASSRNSLLRRVVSVRLCEVGQLRHPAGAGRLRGLGRCAPSRPYLHENYPPRGPFSPAPACGPARGAPTGLRPPLRGHFVGGQTSPAAPRPRATHAAGSGLHPRHFVSTAGPVCPPPSGSGAGLRPQRSFLPQSAFGLRIAAEKSSAPPPSCRLDRVASAPTFSALRPHSASLRACGRSPKKRLPRLRPRPQGAPGPAYRRNRGAAPCSPAGRCRRRALPRTPSAPWHSHGAA